MAFVGLAAAGLFAVVVQTTVAYAASISPLAERGRNIGIVTSGVVVGILGARVVTGALADVWSWRSIYAVLAVLALGLAALVIVVLPSDTRPDRSGGYRSALISLGGMFGQRLFLTRGLIAFFLFASFGTLWSGLCLPLADTPWHLGESQIGLFGLVGLAGALGAAATTSIFSAYGWVGSSLLGAGFAACALAVWATDRQLPLDIANRRSGKAGTR